MGVAIMGAVLSSSLTSHLLEMVGNVEGITAKRAAELAAHPNALIDTAARASLPAPMLVALQTALAAALSNVFWLCTVFSILGLIAVFYLPKDDRRVATQSCSMKTGERMLMAEMTTLDSEHEPSSVEESDDSS